MGDKKENKETVRNRDNPKFTYSSLQLKISEINTGAFSGLPLNLEINIAHPTLKRVDIKLRKFNEVETVGGLLDYDEASKVLLAIDMTAKAILSV